MRTSFSLLLTLFTLFSAHALEDVSLNHGWKYRPVSDPNWTVKDREVQLPHTWNAVYQKGTTHYNRETMVYSRNLDVTPEMAGKRLFLYFEGVNSVADVFVNRQTVGQHKGGYTAFCFEITDYVKPGKNDIQVWASNAFRTDVLPISGDFNVYGGIHRPCHLLITEQNCITPLFYASSGVLVHQKKIDQANAEIVVETRLSLKDQGRNLRLRTSVCDRQGKVVATHEAPVSGERVEQPMQISAPELWNGRNNPYLYTVNVELLDGGQIIDKRAEQTGFRYFHVDKDQGFFLNGKPYELRGFNRHEDIEGKGSALTQEDHVQDMRLMTECGATMVRLAHYPQSEPIYKLSDQQGMIVWSEIPLCGPGGYNFTGYLHNPGLEENARQNVMEMVYQKYNHPSICFWGIFNELLVTDERFKAYDDPVEFVRSLNKLYKSIDTTRLTTFATCVPHSNYLGCSDLIAWNKYFRKPGNEKTVRQFYDEARKTAADYPIGVSEYGDAGSIRQHYDPRHDKARTHSEIYQMLTHEGYWKAIKDSKWLWCKMIWQFSDMQSSIRDEGDRSGVNDKGVVTYDRKDRKDVYYLYKANWTQQPMLYLTGRRFSRRRHAETEVKAYGNVRQATLFVNGKKIGTAQRDEIGRYIWPKVTLTEGKNQVIVQSKLGRSMLVDSCVWILDQDKMPEEIAEITAPFAMPQLQRPTFPNRRISITETGAKENVMSTAAIQKAIDRIAQKGGGTVVVPKGSWLSGRITLKSNVELHLEKGAEWHFSGKIEDYLPVVAIRYEGMDMYSLGAMIYANQAENIALTGQGRLIAPSRDCEISRRQMGGVSEDVNNIPVEKRIYDGSNDQDVVMPIFFGPIHCKNILVEGVTFEQSLFWNVVPTYCENIIIRGITVNSHGVGRTDGIDIDSSINSLIEYCTLDCGDDCFTLKSGRSYDGVRKNKPTENVVIRHCKVKRGVGGLAIGSETAGMIRNVYMHDCEIEHANIPMFFKTRRPRGGGIEHVWVERVHIGWSQGAAFLWDMLGSRKWVGKLADRHPAPAVNELTPVFRHFRIKDVTVENCPKLIRAKGLPESVIEDVVFSNLRSKNKTMDMHDVGTFSFQ